MVSRRILTFMVVFLVLVFLISSEVAAARQLAEPSNKRVPSKESKKIDDDLIGIDARIDCPNGCCGLGPYCRCC